LLTGIPSAFAIVATFGNRASDRIKTLGILRQTLGHPRHNTLSRRLHLIGLKQIVQGRPADPEQAGGGRDVTVGFLFGASKSGKLIVRHDDQKWKSA
jgi:hypothetical protein